MTKEELHEAAEEHLNKVFPCTISGEEDAVDFAVEFHLHQTKKMLEGWTDEVIEQRFPVHMKGKRNEDARKKRRGAKWLRDELLKQLEQ